MKTKIVFRFEQSENILKLRDTLQNILKKTADYPENIDFDYGFSSGVFLIEFDHEQIEHPGPTRNMLKELTQYICETYI